MDTGVVDASAVIDHAWQEHGVVGLAGGVVSVDGLIAAGVAGHRRRRNLLDNPDDEFAAEAITMVRRPGQCRSQARRGGGVSQGVPGRRE